MTAGALAAPARPLEGPARRIPLRPAEGWLTLVSAAIMVMVLGGSLQDAAWTRDATRPYATVLPWLALAGFGFGVFGAKVGWGRWRTHIVGALFGGLLLPLIAGGIVLGPNAQVGWDPYSLDLRLIAMLDSVRLVWQELVVEGRPLTSQFGHYHLVFGVLVWGAGMLAGFSVFGHRRPLDAVVVVGLAILANMALTHDQLTLLVLFSASALLLLIRTHVFEEELTWARRRIGDPASVGQLYLRGGAAFVTAAILGSVVLTATASSAPLQGLWSDLPSHLQDISQFLQRIAPNGGDPRALGIIDIGPSAVTRGLWQPSDRIAFRAQLQPQEDRKVKWRLGTYAEYTRFGWEWGQPEYRDDIAARDIQPNPIGEPTNDVGRRDFFARIVPDAFRDRTIISPNLLQWVDRATEAISVGGERDFTSVESTESMDAYNISAKIPVLQDVQGGITEARLRQAGTAYPPDLFAIYTALPKDSMGPKSTELLNTIKAAVPRPPAGVDPANPYDLAREMESYLRSPDNFRYDSDVRDETDAQCGAATSTVECFAIMKAGYCEYYASTMAVLLRASRIPARIATGFLPGDRSPSNLETVGAKGLHWWVEVYFPGTGWVEFDPTGQVGQPQPIPSGSVGPATPKPTGILPSFPGERESTPPVQPGRGGTSGTGPGPFIAVAVILFIGVLALAYAAIRRTPTKPMHPDKAWGSLASLAARLGIGPRPSQTVYEYAGALGDEVPAVRVELTTLARAKVEVAYGKRDLGADRLRRIAEAYHRLRLALIGLIFRRGLRRARRR